MGKELTGEEIYRRYTWRYTKEDFRYCPRCGHGFTLQPLHIPDEPQLVCHGCKFILYLDPKLVVTGVVRSGKGVLLLRRAEAPQIGQWGLPGGHIERGQDPREALVSEVRQEAGIPVTVDHLLDIYTVKAHGIVQLVFACTASSCDIRANIESLEARFFEQHDLPWGELAFEATTKALIAAGYKSRS